MVVVVSAAAADIAEACVRTLFIAYYCMFGLYFCIAIKPHRLASKAITTSFFNGALEGIFPCVKPNDMLNFS